jgi:presenilin-like A22 family membrane protease
MFLITQLIGIFVISIYQTPGNSIPFNMQPPEQVNTDYSVVSIIISFVIAIGLFFILTRLKAETFIRIWFFVVTILALALSIKAFFLFGFKDIIINNPVPILYLILPQFSIFSAIAFLLIALPLAYFKIFKRNLTVHNITELLIYPGIAAVFVPLLGIIGITILLLIISLYDFWAVWKSQFMQNMAKYQINNLKFFTGFFIPYADKSQKLKIKQIKEKYAKSSDKFLEKQFKKAKIKISLAILGGGDVIFPIITAGVFYKVYGSLIPTLIISLSATLALLYLFIFAKKGKFYPAMPFLTIGMYLGMILIIILKYFNIF